jgi:hypothetical protein
LISNAHVFSGIDSSSKRPFDQNGKVPDQMRIWQHGKTLGSWKGTVEKLRNDDGSARWIQPNDKVAVAALPLTVLPGDVQIYPFDLKLADADIVAMVGMPAFVIGYPAGLSTIGSSILKQALKHGIHAPGFPIWKTGHIATDPDIDYDGLPILLLDATTRGGMSGSPVVLRRTGQYLSKKGSLNLMAGTRDLFLGVYSAHYVSLELGYIWKPKVITDLLATIK